MYGICGTVGFGNSESVRRMAYALTHRGPDEEGFFEDPEAPVFLGNRRLSIIDVEGGHQPVYSEDRQVVATQAVGQLISLVPAPIASVLGSLGYFLPQTPTGPIVSNLTAEPCSEITCWLSRERARAGPRRSGRIDPA